ncbi:S8 family serine peptidase [Halogeometricum sp. S1BR25-6]|uniref:S8 family serine peptidase n=1 Tax=Halogeometricum salsisoli TaxID=2950536 RepID=A0ABU2GAW0_9EURY|nr:S8 family serine peptidase [Halogeometricum sp. S1BR25-6]MDS0297930.1 S8 family serine peptidase [Halogeometricum sp. S1BR25-6]
MSPLTRRALLKGVAGSTVALGAMGTATAADDREQYVVTASGTGALKRLERSDAEVVASIAGDTVHLVLATEAADIEGISGVASVDPNEGYRLLGPAKRATSTAESLDDQYASLQWDKMAETTGAFEAHDTATGAGSTVAIIDTGIDEQHPDIPAVMEKGRLFRADGLTSPDDDPTVAGDETIEANLHPDTEEVEPYVWRGPPETRSQSAADDVQSHGSHCAGIAAAKDDIDADGVPEDLGVVGMAPDAEAVPLRVFYWKRFEDYELDGDADGEVEETIPVVTTLYTTDFDIMSAIDYAPDVGADAANMSLGGGVVKGSAHSSGEHVAYQRVTQDAVERGTVVTASAGNASANLQQGGFYTLPNSVPGTLSVSATGPNNELAFYSNYGTSDIDVGAPGGGYETLEKTLAADTEWPYPTNLVLSTVPPDLNDGLAYDWYAGTSMAAPQVAGLVALIREVAPEMSAKKIQNVIERTARYSTGRSSPKLGAGVVYAPDALEEAQR